MKIYYIFIPLLLGILHLQAQQSKPTILWKIVSPNNPDKISYLLGSDHRYGETFLNSLPVIKEKIMQAEIVMSETGSDATLHMAELTQTIPYSQLFKQEEITTVDSFLEKHGMNSIRELDSVHYPINMLSLFVFRELMSMGDMEMQNEEAMDNVIVRWAADANKRIIGLDSGMIIRQNAFNFGATDQEVAENMVEIIRNPALLTAPSKDKEYGSLNINYDFDKVYPHATDPSMKHLVIDRNRYWFSQLCKWMFSYNCFAVVGLSHLKYRDGLLKVLALNNFTVTPVKLTRKK